MKHSASILVMALLLAPAAAPADGGGGGGGNGRPSVAEDPVIAAAQAAIARADWMGAQAGLKEALQRAPQNADYHNLYAYTTRKGPSPNMDLVFKHYNEALRLNPKHRGAHEYIGEAYLMVNDLPKAKQHLAVLDRLCFFGCEEYTDLKKAVAAYEAGQKTVSKAP